MRKINTIHSVLLLVIFMLHGLMGSFMLLGIGSSAGKILAWVGVAVLAAHTVIGVILTINSLKISKIAGNSYLKQNAVFWAWRASGLAILILMFFHIGLFGGVQDGIYILFPFTRTHTLPITNGKKIENNISIINFFLSVIWLFLKIPYTNLFFKNHLYDCSAYKNPKKPDITF